jgi:hypothetical protein
MEMSKRNSNPPDTSRAAYKAATAEMIAGHKQQILQTLKLLKQGTGEQIASRAKINYWQVQRRLSELEKDQLIFKPGHKLPTKTGRLSYVRQQESLHSWFVFLAIFLSWTQR